jgi:hypothetical protein
LAAGAGCVAMVWRLPLKKCRSEYTEFRASQRMARHFEQNKARPSRLRAPKNDRKLRKKLDFSGFFGVIPVDHRAPQE